MNSKDMQAIKDREEQLNTQSAIKNHKNALTSQTVFGEDVSPESEPSGISPRVQQNIQLKSDEKQSLTLYRLIMLRLQEYIANYASAEEKELYFFSSTPKAVENQYEYMNGKKLKPSVFFIKYGIGASPSSVLSDIRKNRNSTLSEPIVFRLIFALHLDIEKARELYKKATKQADFKNTPDHRKIIECIRKKIYKIDDVHEELENIRYEMSQRILEQLKMKTQSDNLIQTLKSEMEGFSVQEKIRKSEKSFSEILRSVKLESYYDEYFDNPFVRSSYSQKDDDLSDDQYIAEEAPTKKELNEEIEQIKQDFFAQLELYEAAPASIKKTASFSEKYTAFVNDIKGVKSVEQADSLFTRINREIVEIKSEKDTLIAKMEKHLPQIDTLSKQIDDYINLLSNLCKRFPELNFRMTNHKENQIQTKKEDFMSRISKLTDKKEAQGLLNELLIKRYEVHIGMRNEKKRINQINTAFTVIKNPANQSYTIITAEFSMYNQLIDHILQRFPDIPDVRSKK